MAHDALNGFSQIYLYFSHYHEPHEYPCASFAHLGAALMTTLAHVFVFLFLSPRAIFEYRVLVCHLIVNLYTYIWVMYMVNVGKYSIHGASGYLYIDGYRWMHMDRDVNMIIVIT